MKGIAEQVPGLNVSSWEANRQDASLKAQVASDGQAAVAKGMNSTPTLVIQGPKSEANPFIPTEFSFSKIASAISSVS